MLTRGIRSFTATLPSSHPGIFFTARIAGKLSEPPGCWPDPVQLATAIRRALREAATDVSCHASPADLAEATDMCNQRLAMPMAVPSRPNVTVTATLTLRLSGDNQKALGEFIAARRRQGIQDHSQVQRTSAIREYFSDPAYVLSWWLDKGGQANTKLPKADDLREFTELLKEYPRVVDRPIDYQVLDLLRAFIAEFPELHQKQALLTLLSNGFDRAGAGTLARQAASLASEEFSSNGTPSNR